MKIKDINKAILIWGVVSKEGIAQIKEEKSLVVVPENRPYLIGLKHNIPLLTRENIDFVYCTDNTVGLLFFKEKIKETLLFYRECREEGIIGVCGSLYVSLFSKLHRVSVKVILQGEFDFSLADKDASRLGGKSFIWEKTSRGCIIEADDELLSWEVL